MILFRKFSNANIVFKKTYELNLLDDHNKETRPQTPTEIEKKSYLHF